MNCDYCGKELVGHQLLHCSARCRSKIHEIKNHERILQRSKDWYTNNPERHLENVFRWRTENPEKVKYARKKWGSKHPEYIRVKTINRRAKIKGLEGSFTKSDWDYCKWIQGNRCAYCGKYERLSVDHVIPVAKDGNNDIYNIVGACKSCNCKKGKRSLIVWIQEITRIGVPA